MAIKGALSMQTAHGLARRRAARSFVSAAALMLLVLGLASGCVGTLANLVHMANGNLVPARYAGLKEKRVAVVCVSDSESFGPSYASQTLAREVGKLIKINVPKVTVISSQAIANWIDRNNWDSLDYKAVGRGVNADMVVAIDLSSFSLHEGKTLYKGRAELRVVVHDMLNGGDEVFVYQPSEILFPENSGFHTTDMSEEDFRARFLSLLANRVARQFYASDVQEDFARDTTLIRR
jgi:hypothetical protein